MLDRPLSGPMTALVLGFLVAGPSSAQTDDPLTLAYPADVCGSCEAWSVPQAGIRVHGGTYYVGTRELTVLLVTSEDGHVLIDGALPNVVPAILENIRALGFDPRDIRLILNSHAHFDHAAGIAALRRATGARVAASHDASPVLESGQPDRDDPQAGSIPGFAPVGAVERFEDGDTLRVGEIELVGYVTPGHTPGGTTWTWRSCDDDGCVDVVYVDSQTPIARAGFRFSDRPELITDFEQGVARIESLRCDLLITPHPGASSFWDRFERDPQGLIEPDACRRYAATARDLLARRLAQERTAP